MTYDADLEREIDRVGRGRVFARMKHLGWRPYDAPPKWVWRQVVRELDEIHDTM